MVVHGHDGLDEITTTAASTIWHIRNGVVVEEVFHPESVGIELVTLADLRGGTAQENAAISTGVLSGVPGPYRDVVLLNAAASLVVTGKAPDMATGLQLAAESVTSGAALRSLELLVAESNRHHVD